MIRKEINKKRLDFLVDAEIRGVRFQIRGANQFHGDLMAANFDGAELDETREEQRTYPHLSWTKNLLAAQLCYE